MRWASDAEGMEGATKIVDEGDVHLRRNQPQEEYSFYQNFSRMAPIKRTVQGHRKVAEAEGPEEEVGSSGYLCGTSYCEVEMRSRIVTIELNFSKKLLVSRRRKRSQHAGSEKAIDIDL